MDRDACWEGAEMEGGDRSRDVCSFFFFFFFFFVSCTLLLTTAFASVPIWGCAQFAHQTTPERRTQPSAVIAAPWALLQAS